MKNITLAGCVIYDSDNRFYLLHRNTPKRVQWELPGGKIEEGESPVDCAVREIKEELGVDIKIVKKLGNKGFKEDDYEMHYTWFLAEVLEGIPRIIETDKFDDLRTYSWDELNEIEHQLSENTKNLLNEYTAGLVV